ncbi:MAG: CoA pyrophosphatase [Dehalococcoidia bacterium]
MEERIKQILAQREINRITDPGLTPAAVLAPLYDKEGEWHILFTKRTHLVADHKGQISFPGGKREKSDCDFLSTALREAWEEIGLEPALVNVLGELDNEKTISNFVIHPFLAIVPHPYDFLLSSAEVEALVEFPISVLLDKANFREDTVIHAGEKNPAYYYSYGDQVIWGATARILKKLLDLTGIYLLDQKTP